MKYNAKVKFAGSAVTLDVEIKTDLSPKDLKESYRSCGHKLTSIKVVE